MNGALRGGAAGLIVAIILAFDRMGGDAVRVWEWASRDVRTFIAQSVALGVGLGMVLWTSGKEGSGRSRVRWGRLLALLIGLTLFLWAVYGIWPV